MKRWLYDNGLSVAMFGCFFIFLLGLVFTGHAQHNAELISHGQATIGLGRYLGSGEFIEAVFENWESEFLQMGMLVVLTIFLRQKGSADSKRLRGKEDVDTHSRYSIRHAGSWRLRRKAVGRMLYANSLSIALFTLFVLSFALHAVGGAQASNDQARQHGEQLQSVWQYMTGSQFWFESFQNWQSEFLSVGSLMVLSIFLRQRGSPESKPVGAPNAKTGE